jgi:hypothetical protein
MKKTIANKIGTFIFTFIIVNNCLGQNMRPNVKIKLESLYPNAKIIGGNQPIGEPQNILIYCNCPEFSGEIQLTFDTNANLMITEYFFDSLSSLPNAILSYIKSNSSKSVSFDSSMAKSINYRGETYYNIFMKENDIPYEIKIKSTGEIISKTCILGRS